MPGDAQATRRRLLDAAAEEFATYGIAGARVDRIAAKARSNKAQIYHYYGSKDQLFDAVFTSFVVETVREIPIDVSNLPEYAARLFDGYEKRPHVLRLATWYRLERAGTDALLDSIVKSNRDKVAAISRAQKSGDLSSHFAAADLLALILSISTMWSTQTPEFAALTSRHSTVHRRSVIVAAVAALLDAR